METVFCSTLVNIIYLSFAVLTTTSWGESTPICFCSDHHLVGGIHPQLFFVLTTTSWGESTPILFCSDHHLDPSLFRNAASLLRGASCDVVWRSLFSNPDYSCKVELCKVWTSSSQNDRWLVTTPAALSQHWASGRR